MNLKHIQGHGKLLILLFAALLFGALATYLASRPEGTNHASSASTPRKDQSNVREFASAELEAAGRSWRERARAASLEGFRSLMKDALQIQDDALRNAAVAEIVTAWINRDAESFGAYFASLEVLAATDEMPHRVVMTALGKAMTQLTAEASASHHVVSIIERFVTSLAASSPEEALRWATQYLLDDALDSALVTVAREFARIRPEEGQQIISQIDAPLRRMQAMYAVGGVWAEREPARALAWANSLAAPTERAMTLNSVLLSVAHKDLALASSELVSAQSRMAAEYTAKRKTDLAAMKLTEADLANDPERYKEMLEAGELAPPVSPDVELLAEAARVIASRVAETDPRRAIAWAESLEHEFLKLKSVTGAITGWARTSPVEALAYQQRKYPEYNEMLTNVFESWAAMDPVEAARNSLTIAEPARAKLALETVVKRWVAAGDVMVVTRWVDQLPAQQRSDSLEMTIVAALSDVAPEESWKRAQGISNERLKYRALKSAFSVLVMERPDVARSLLTSAALDAKHAERLQEMLEGAGG